MATTFSACDPADDDYIDMEVNSYSNFFCHSHPQPREFEFQMSSIVQEKEPTTSPADELFYKGKLLPLHLPPRLQMKLKQSSLGSKLKASRAYLKSWFGKSGCSYETYATSTKVADEGSVSKARENLNKHVQVAKKNPYGQIHRDRYQSSNSVMRSYKEKTSEDGSNQHRRSFSVGIKLLSGNKSSSSSSVFGSTSFSFSNKSYGCQARQLLKRCSSANSEIENSIQGAIAHCKKSQQMFSSKKNVSEVGVYSMSASRTSVCEDHERVELWRG
uniref:Membrane-associated kinase regulator 4 n=1 Tax=Cajanus cajan TaxID=3821 RepID=A0A151U828_CAJCA|nr:hypothetical protein KK1_008146 [Cajanus cajan]